jgi:outer membrane protein TolC
VTSQAVYQSEVANLPFSLPGVPAPTVPHDQYKVAIGLEQLVYDGGLVRGQKAVESAAAEAATLEAEVAAYGLRDGVEGAFFSVLLADAQSRSLALYLEDLSARKGQLEVLVAQGVRTRAEVDALRAEIIRLEQQQAVAKSIRTAGIETLEALTGWALEDTAELIAPKQTTTVLSDRPERALFEASRKQLSRQSDLVARRNRPKVAAFGEAAYGQPPGLNVFEDSFKGFFSVGIRLSMPVWDWRSVERDREEIDVRTELVSAREAAFDQQIQVALARAAADIRQAEAMLARDQELVDLRAGIARDSAVRLENGVATVTDYLVDQNAEFQARLAMDQHTIQLMQARARYSTIQGAQ